LSNGRRCTSPPFSFLARGADPEKFEPVGHRLKMVMFRNLFLERGGKTFFEFDHQRTTGADEMVVMPVFAFADEFKARGAVAEIKLLDHPQFLEQLHGPVNRGQVALSGRQEAEDFPVGERMPLAPQNFQDGRARAGDFVGAAPQTAGQRG